jgi:hypothetical protein
MSAVDLRAGPEALRLIRERGLREEDVDVVPAASGGPKWLVLAGLDRFLFAHFFKRKRDRPLHLIGASIGSFRLACLAQNDPVAALKRAHSAYVSQRYPPKPSASLVTETTRAILKALLGPTGVSEIMSQPSRRLHVITTQCRGLLASERPFLQGAGLALAASGNVLSRRTLASHMGRVIFHNAGESSPFLGLSDFPTRYAELTTESVEATLLASASIPLWLTGVQIPGEGPGIFRDGGVVDYHLDIEFGPGTGLVLYPHFYPYVIPGWFDKSLFWRRASPRNFRRALIVSPSAKFVEQLPNGKIPDREDFFRLTDAQRIRSWNTVISASERLGEEMHELLATGKLADHVKPI